MKKIIETIDDICFDQLSLMFSLLSFFLMIPIGMLHLSSVVYVPIIFLLFIVNAFLPGVGTTIMTFIWIFTFIVGFIEPLSKSYNSFSVLFFYVTFTIYVILILILVILPLFLYLAEHYSSFSKKKKGICILLLVTAVLFFVAMIILEVFLAKEFVVLRRNVTSLLSDSWMKGWIFKK